VSETPPLRLDALAPLLRQALAAEGRFRWQLRGRSMTPTLPTACQIEVIPLPEPAPLGALVVFAAGDRLIAHRLVRRAGGRWVTQGDGALAADAPLAAWSRRPIGPAAAVGRPAARAGWRGSGSPAITRCGRCGPSGARYGDWWAGSREAIEIAAKGPTSRRGAPFAPNSFGGHR
jgi:hypothetical protein